MAGKLTRYWKLAIVWAVSLVAVGAMSLSAQDRGRPLPPTEVPTIVSGSDVGFRIERTQAGIQIGKVVVRINGRWVDTETPTAAAR